MLVVDHPTVDVAESQLVYVPLAEAASVLARWSSLATYFVDERGCMVIHPGEDGWGARLTRIP